MVKFIAVVLAFFLGSLAMAPQARSTEECDGLHTVDDLDQYVQTEIHIPEDVYDLFRERLFAITPPPIPQTELEGVLVRVFANSPQNSTVVLQQGRCLVGMTIIPTSLLSMMLMPKLLPPPTLRQPDFGVDAGNPDNV